MSIIERAFSGFPTVEDPLINATMSLENEITHVRGMQSDSIEESIGLILEAASNARNVLREYSRLRGNNSRVHLQTQRVLSVIRFDQFPTSFKGFTYV